MDLKVLQLEKTPIIYQLQIEEALLRTTNDNWLILNDGSIPSIVMGISGKPEELINLEASKNLNLPLIKRYSGGGTVVVDEETIFFTLILNKKVLPCDAFPKPIMKWVESLLSSPFAPHAFALTENDFTIHDKKCGGNAQYLQKDRFVHHTTFLWDYKKELMSTLLLPKSRPKYRQSRSHDEFLCSLSNFYDDKKIFMKKIVDAFESKFKINHVKKESVQEILAKPHRKSTVCLEY